MTAEQIKSLRKLLGLTQQAFSERVKVSCGAVYKWERGLSKPGRLAIDKLEQLQQEAVEKKERE